MATQADVLKAGFKKVGNKEYQIECNNNTYKFHVCKFGESGNSWSINEYKLGKSFDGTKKFMIKDSYGHEGLLLREVYDMMLTWAEENL